MILAFILLTSIPILLFGISAVDASLSDLNNIKPTVPIDPETESRKGEAESSTQDGTYPTESHYCKVDLVDDSTFLGYTIKAGTDNNDQLIGTANKDLILGLDGDDWIHGSGGDDIICGGNGNDHLFGESYPNVIIRQPGNPGKDFIFGQEGNDIINNGEELERDYGDAGDILYGGPGDDAITGNDGNDKLSGGNGKDTLDGGDGKDQLDGGLGDDRCYDNQVETFPTFLNCEEGDPAVTIYRK